MEKTGRIGAAVGLVLVLAGIAWTSIPRARDEARRVHAASPAPSGGQPRDVSGSTIPTAPPSATPRRGTLTPIAQESGRTLLLEQDDWKAALSQLDALSSLSVGERLFYKHVILNTCWVQMHLRETLDPQALAAIDTGTLDAWIEKATASIKNPAQRAAQALNHRRHVANVCRGFPDPAVSAPEAQKALGEAAAAGDLKAQARLLHNQRHESRSNPSGDGFPRPMTASERDLLVTTLMTGDPIAIRVAGPALSAGSQNQSLRFGADQVDLGTHAPEIWALVACEFGYECGWRNKYVSVTCAERGLCARDYESTLRDYTLSPHDFDFVQRTALAITDAIRRRDPFVFQLVDQRGQSDPLTSGQPPPIGVR